MLTITSKIADEVAAQHAVVVEDREWFVGVLRTVERETRLQYRDTLERIAEHLEGNNINAALDLAREALASS